MVILLRHPSIKHPDFTNIPIIYKDCKPSRQKNVVAKVKEWAPEPYRHTGPIDKQKRGTFLYPS